MFINSFLHVQHTVRGKVVGPRFYPSVNPTKFSATMKKSLVLKDWSGCALVMREDYASKRGYRMSILESHIKMSRPWLMYINFLENQLSGPSFALLRFNSNVSFQNGRTDFVEAHETQPVSKQILNVTRVNCVETMNCLFEYFSYLPRRQKENINWWAQVFRASQIFFGKISCAVWMTVPVWHRIRVL